MNVKTDYLVKYENLFADQAREIVNSYLANNFTATQIVARPMGNDPITGKSSGKWEVVIFPKENA